MTAWSAIVDRFGCATASFDDRQELTAASPNFVRWLGRPAPIGAGIDTLLTRGSGIYWETSVMPRLDGQGHAHDVALELNGANGTVALLAFAKLDPTGIDCLFVPFQHRERFELSLAAAETRRMLDAAELHRLQAIDAMRTDVVNIIAHELATPMTPILLQLAILNRSANDAAPEVLKAIGKLGASVDQLQYFHSELLEAARLQASKSALPIANVRLRDAATRAVSEWLPRHQRPGEVVIEGVAVDAQSNRKAVASSLRRLLDNAHRFSAPEETIHIRVAAEPTPSLTVVDHGRGIDPTRLAQLARPFVKGHSDRESSLLGGGLGLYIVAELMRAQRGALSIDSNGEGTGTAATLRFEME
jgi:signal transduction histidine kinase